MRPLNSINGSDDSSGAVSIPREFSRVEEVWYESKFEFKTSCYLRCCWEWDIVKFFREIRSVGIMEYFSLLLIRSIAVMTIVLL